MPVDAKYKTSATASGGGRDGRTATEDGTLDLQLVVPKELGGPGGEGANPDIGPDMGPDTDFMPHRHEHGHHRH